MSKRFEGKSVILMGAATGIGNATAKLFAEEGAGLCLADVNPAVEGLFKELQGGYSELKGGAVRADVTKFEDCQKVAKAAYEQFGKIDVLACIAGTIQQASVVKDLPQDEWDRVMNINLKGHYLMCKAVVPYMMEQKSGRIVTIASWWGREAHGFFSAYCASKGGLILFTQSLAAEMGDYNVTVNTVCPGMINTGMHRKALEDEAAERGITFEELRDIEWGKAPLKTAGDPEDIGYAVLFLASDQAKYMTGAAVDVNGGVYLH